MRLLIAGSLALLAGATLALIASEDGTFSRYGDELASQLQKDQPLHTVWLRIEATISALGELFLNVPVHSYRAVLIPAGLAPALFFFLTYRKTKSHPAISVYIASLVALLFIWPFYTTRLWVTLIPLLMLHTLGVFATLPRTGRRFRAAQMWVAWMLFMGLVALTHVSRVSLSGEKFMSRWGSRGGLSEPGRPNAYHDARAKIIARKFDAGNVAWRALLQTPAP